MQNRNTLLFSSITGGLILGIAVSAVILKIMIAADFAFNMKLIPAAAAVLCIPLCLLFLRSRFDMRLVFGIMTAVSWLITMYYGYTVSRVPGVENIESTFLLNVFRVSSFLHVLMLASGLAGLRYVVRKDDVC